MPGFDSNVDDDETSRVTTPDIAALGTNWDQNDLSRIQARLAAVLEGRDRLISELSEWRRKALHAEVEIARVEAKAEALEQRGDKLKASIHTLHRRIARLEVELAEACGRLTCAEGSTSTIAPDENPASTSSSPEPAPAPAQASAAPAEAGSPEESAPAPAPAEPEGPKRLSAPSIQPLAPAARRTPAHVFNAVAILGANDASLMSCCARLTRPGPSTLIATLQSGQYDLFLVSACDRANEGSWRDILTNPTLLELIADGVQTAQRLGKKTVLMDCEKIDAATLSTPPLNGFDLLVTRDPNQAKELGDLLSQTRVVLRADALLDPSQHSPFGPRSTTQRKEVLAPVANDQDADWLSGQTAPARLNLLDSRTAWSRAWALENAALKRGDLMPALAGYARSSLLSLARPDSDRQTRAVLNACGAPCVHSTDDAATLLDDEMALNKMRHTAWRDAAKNTPSVSGFLEDIAIALGLRAAPSLPARLIVVARVEAESELIELQKNLTAQSRSPDTLILMSQTLDMASLDNGGSDFPAGEIKTYKGDWSGLVTLCSEVTDIRSTVVVMRNTAFYGRHYLADISLAAAAVCDCVIGRHSRYVQKDRSSANLIGAGRGMRLVTGISAASAAFTGTAINRRNLENALSWTWFTAREPIVSLGPSGFVEISDTDSCDRDAVHHILEA